MSRRVLVAAMSILAAVTLSRAQTAVPHETAFPFGLFFAAAAMDGKPFNDRSRIFKITRDPTGHWMWGYAGCNHYNARVEFSAGDRFAFRSGRITGMYCRGRIEIEQPYFETLKRMRRWRMQADTLFLEGEDVVMQFEPATSVFPRVR